jgi:DNA replication ATP-dependent helicase Dna2
VVGTTCLGAGHPLFSQRTFDVCIVDESTQVLQVAVLRSLFCAKKFVLIGDPEQLPPVIRSKTARCVPITHSAVMELVLLASLTI